MRGRQISNFQFVGLVSKRGNSMDLAALKQVCLVAMYSGKEKILRICFTLGNLILSLL